MTDDSDDSITLLVQFVIGTICCIALAIIMWCVLAAIFGVNKNPPKDLTYEQCAETCAPYLSTGNNTATDCVCDMQFKTVPYKAE